MKQFIKIIPLFLLFFVLSVPVTFAASIFVDSSKEVKVGSVFEVAINADTDQVLINSIDITLDYDDSKLSFVGYKQNAGVIGLWLHAPYEKNGQVYMDGIIPGGVSGLYDPSESEAGAVPIVTLIFKANHVCPASFIFTNSEIFKHDGIGSLLLHQKQDTTIEITLNQNTQESTEQDVLDTTKPEPFDVTFIEPISSADTPPMIVFNASDTDSGIKEYQVSTNGSNWKNVESPHIVSRGILPYALTIRAFDFYGNFQDSQVIIPGIVSAPILSVIIILIFGLCILMYRVIKYKA